MKNRSVLVKIIDVLTIIFLLICLAGALYIGFRHGIAGTHSFGERIVKIMGEAGSAGIIRMWKIVLLALLVVLSVVFLTAYRLINICPNRGKIIICIVSFAVMVVLQLTVALSVSFIGNHDSYEVMDQALAIAQGSQKQVNYGRLFYFQKYSNNNFFILLCVGLFRLARLFGVREYVRFITVINVTFMDLGILFLVWAVRVAKDQTDAAYVLILNVLNPMMYLFVGWNYTATMSMLPMMASLFILVLLNYRKMSTGRQVILCVVFGFVLAVSYLIRPTAFFIAVAYLVYRLIRVICGYFSKKRLALLTMTFVVFGASFAGLNGASEALNPDQSQNFPVAHWLMIGADNDGRASGESSAYTRKFNGREQMKAGDIERIRQINTERGMAATLGHYAKKPVLTWSDGTAEYYDRFNIIKGTDASVYTALAGEKSPLIMVYSQAYRIMILVLSVLGVFVIMRKDDSMLETVVLITLFGAQLFYIIWEGKPAYSLPFIPLLILQGLPAMEHGFAKRDIDIRGLCATAAVSTCIVTICQIPLLGKIPVQMIPSVMTGKFRFTHDAKIEDGESLTQEFTAGNDFNRIEFSLKGKNGGYEICLMSGEKTVDSAVIRETDVHGQKKKICIDVPAQKAGSGYSVCIRNTEGTELTAKTSITDALELYDGKTTINGKNTKDRLLIDVMRKSE